MIISTGDIPNKYEIIDIVSGNAVQSKDIFKDLGASLKGIVGGKLGSYKKLLQETREMAIEEMKEKANVLGADAIIYVRQTTSSIIQGASEISVLGTAIRFI